MEGENGKLNILDEIKKVIIQQVQLIKEDLKVQLGEKLKEQEAAITQFKEEMRREIEESRKTLKFMQNQIQQFKEGAQTHITSQFYKRVILKDIQHVKEVANKVSIEKIDGVFQKIIAERLGEVESMREQLNQLSENVHRIETRAEGRRVKEKLIGQ